MQDDSPEVQGSPEHASVEQVLGYVFSTIEADQYEVNRRDASRAAGLADALGWARAHPEIYALPLDPDPVETAVRCGCLEAGLRVNLSAQAVRNLVYVADTARAELPLLWSQAAEGFATIAQVEAAVSLLPSFHDQPTARAIFDHDLSEFALQTTSTAFRKKARLLAQRLTAEPAEERHRRALSERRVVVESAGDGMGWLHVYMPMTDCVAAKQRATSVAKHMAKDAREGRTRDQIRADLVSAWLRAVGTPGEVKTKVFVTVPLDRLSSEAQATVRKTPAGIAGVDLSQEALLVGEEPIPVAEAARLLLEAGEFTRVITDPITGVIIDMDRRKRTVTRAQREWILLHHGTCPRDGCNRTAVEADIDHWIAFHSPGRGKTDLENLHPFCRPDHRLKDRTRVKFHRREDLTVELRFSSGYRSAVDRVMRRAPIYRDGAPPPF